MIRLMVYSEDVKARPTFYNTKKLVHVFILKPNSEVMMNEVAKLDREEENELEE
jgi:hypothetical protein